MIWFTHDLSVYILLQVEKSDPLPQHICDLCYENLETAYQLRITCLETLDIQKERLKDTYGVEDAKMLLHSLENGKLVSRSFD